MVKALPKTIGGEWKIAQKYFAEMFPCKAMELLLDGKSIFN